MEPNEKNNANNSQQGSETPFFARFLESQHAEGQPGAANDEAVFQTLKYPSDRDEWEKPFCE